MAIVVQIDGSSRSALKTDGLVDALGIVWMSRQSRTDNGVVGHHQAGTDELHRADVHQATMDGAGGVMRVKNDAQDTLLVGEEGVMARAHQFLTTTQDGV